MILLIDNFDSFTFNLYQYLGELGEEVKVFRNNQVTIEQIKELKPAAIILSPGPGRPEDAGICVEVIRTFYKEIPILGICLGHQAIAYAFEAKIKQASTIKHGKTSFITHSGRMFDYLPSPLEVMRYHSLSVEKRSLPEQLQCTALSMDDREVMAIEHRQYPVYGLQFHPESIGTPTGKQMLKNFIQLAERMKRNEGISTSIS